VEMLARPPAPAAQVPPLPHVAPPAEVPPPVTAMQPPLPQLPPHREAPPRRELPPLTLVAPQLPPQPAGSATAGRARAGDVVARPTRAAYPDETAGRELRYA